jgi:hypothetical protein
MGTRLEPNGFGPQQDVTMCLADLRTPRDIGDDLFLNLLKSENREREDRRLEEHIREASLLSGGLGLPSGASLRAESILEGDGVDPAEARRQIRGAMDSKGFIRLDRLWGNNRGKNQHVTFGLGPSVVRPEHAPQLQAFLFEQGLGAGDVKALLEKSVGRDGYLDVKKMAAELAKMKSSLGSEKALTEGLGRFGVPCQARGGDAMLQDPLTRELASLLSLSESETSRKEIQRVLANILRDKGMPPEEVKSFLETLSPKHVRSVLKQMEIRKQENDGTLHEDILNRLVLHRRDSLKKNGVQDKRVASFGEDGGGEAKGGSRRSSLRHKGSVESTTQRGQGLDNAAGDELSVKSKEAFLSNPSERRTSESGRTNPGEPQGPRTQGVPFLRQEAFLKTEKLWNEGVSTGLQRPPGALPDPLPKVMDQMTWMVRSGQQRGRIQLSPPDLGRLEIELVIEKGTLKAHFGAENPWAKEILESNLPQLKQHLSELGFVVEKFDVMVGLGHRQGNSEEGLWAGDERSKHASKRQIRSEDGEGFSDTAQGVRLKDHHQLYVRV